MFILKAFIKRQLLFNAHIDKVKEKINSEIYDKDEHFFTNASGIYGKIYGNNIELFYHKKYSSRSPLIFKGNFSNLTNNQTQLDFSYCFQNISSAIIFIYFYLIIFISEIFAAGLFTLGILKSIWHANFEYLYLIGISLGFISFVLLFSGILYYIFYFMNNKHICEFFDNIKQENESIVFHHKIDYRKKNKFHIISGNLTKAYFIWIALIIITYLP
ncbi:MAG TPA: hypothetical protein PLQ81_10045, partial [bacterium]|nr:hypothetical protein [bacterium]